MKPFLHSTILVFLAVLANHVAPLLNCRLVGALRRSAVAQHAALYAIVYFSVGAFNPDRVSPATIGLRSLALWLAFVAFQRLPPALLPVALAALVVLGVLHDDALYRADDASRRRRDAATAVVVALLVVGNVAYLARQRRARGADFSWATYVFGRPACVTR